jgi:hypothetical protein
LLAQAAALKTFSEINVALAGFAALAGVIGERLDSGSHAQIFERLRQVVIIALLYLVYLFGGIIQGSMIFFRLLEETIGLRHG